MAAKIINLGTLLPKCLLYPETSHFKDTSGVPNPRLTLFKGMLHLLTSQFAYKENGRHFRVKFEMCLIIQLHAKYV